MTEQLLLPQIGFSVDEAVLTEWLADDGAEVSKGQVIYTVESDKSVQEIEAPVSGKLKIIAKQGETYPVGHLLGEIA